MRKTSKPESINLSDIAETGQHNPLSVLSELETGDCGPNPVPALPQPTPLPTAKDVSEGFPVPASAPPSARGHSFFSSLPLARRKKKGEKLPLIGRRSLAASSDSFRLQDTIIRNAFPDDPEFQTLTREVEASLGSGIQPARIPQGSSGSYFVFNRQQERIGVFKPKDEEPYGQLNPKWKKALHRLACPCCFGRSCLPQNQGYLSEAGASLVDKALCLGLVPPTRVVALSSPVFNYSREQIRRAALKTRFENRFPDVSRRLRLHTGLPFKVGSLQSYVNGYQDAASFLRSLDSQRLPDSAHKEFLNQFQRLVVLDYLIRNTDRSSDNWLVHCASEETEETLPDLVPSKERGRVRIAAIDNGLAFPFKHPDEWRAYPFLWSSLPIAQEPFTQDVIDAVLPKLEDVRLIRTLCRDLLRLFKKEPRATSIIIDSQLAVLRGQAWNLRQALRTRQSPAELSTAQPRIARERRNSTANGEDNWEAAYDLCLHNRYPFFSCF